jgi:hypothetical protein
MEKLEEVQGSAEEEFTTFEDIFALALANTKSSRFKADSNEWHRVLYEVCEKYQDKMPQLGVIFFRERPPLPPQSKEFYQLITTLSMSGLISLPNPNYEYIVMERTQKERARELEGKRLDKYKDYIRKITELLDDRLAVEG